jgi:hypothetical protein
MTDTEIVTVHVPFHIRKRGGRKKMILPDAALTQHRHIDKTLIKGLVRAFRWKRMLDAGHYATLGDLAAHEKISPSYLTRVLRLTLLAPDTIDAILDGQLSPDATLANLMDPFPFDWDEKRSDGRFSRS